MIRERTDSPGRVVPAVRAAGRGGPGAGAAAGAQDALRIASGQLAAGRGLEQEITGILDGTAPAAAGRA